MTRSYGNRGVFETLLAALVFCILTVPARSQPHGFSKRAFPDITGNLNPLTEILRTDLSTGQVTHFMTLSGETYFVFWDVTQRWLFHGERDYLGAVRVADTSDDGYFARIAEIPAPPLYIQAEHCYVMWWLSAGGENEAMTAKVLSEDSLTIIDSLSGDIVAATSPFLSADGSLIYGQFHDKVSNEFNLMAYSFSTRSVAWHRSLKGLNPSGVEKFVNDGKRGMALLGYEYPTGTPQDTRYARYDVANNVLSQSATFPYRSRAILSPTAMYIIAQRIEVDSTGGSWRKHSEGNVWVFDASSGRVVRKMNFPPGGTLTVFESDTLHFYYHIEDTDTWYKASLAPEPDIKGGLYLSPSTAPLLSVRAKSAHAFAVSDTVRALTATIRYPACFGFDNCK